MKNVNAKSWSSALIANGDANGWVTVADASKFVVGAIVNICSAFPIEDSKECRISAKRGNQIRLRLSYVKEYVGSDMSGYLLTNSPVLAQDPQMVSGAEYDESYESEVQESVYGAIQVNVTATLIVAARSTRHDIIIQNLGPNDIYIGSDASVTTSTGIKVPKSGGAITLVNTKEIYGITTVLQVSPADTRFIENFV